MGTIISFLFRIPFRFIALIVLDGNEYSIFSLTLQTFLLTLQITGLHLHSPFTREIRINKASKDIEVSFALSYWMTNFIGFFFMFMMGFFYLRAFSILQLLLFSGPLILCSLSEFFLAYVRAHGHPLRSALITSIPAIFEGLIIIPFIFDIQIFLNLNFFIILYCFRLITSFIIGALLSNSSWKTLFFSLQKLRNKEYLMNAVKNIKKGSSLSIRGLFHSIGNWLIVYLAIIIMTPDLFKIFDLSLFIVSFMAMFCSNIAISTLSVSKIEDKSQTNKILFYTIIIGIIITFITFLFIEFIPLELILYKFFNLYLSTEGKNIMRVAILLSIIMFITAFINGKIQALGKYKEITLSSLLSFLGFLSFSILGFFMKSGTILIIGLIFFNLIELILFYYYIFK